MQAFRRNTFSSMLLRLPRMNTFDDLKKKLEKDQRITVDVKRESRFYAEQSEQMVRFIKVLGMFITVIFSIGATIGAAITMHASVANRVGEIGTLRALGFSRANVLIAFLIEAITLGAAGGVIGLAAASTTSYLHVSTTNIRTFSEISFHLRMTPLIACEAMLFACAMGVVGGFIPALRAARLEIVEALRAR
jgi:ABC-type antimicrobial peptide transport system permease subunit